MANRIRTCANCSFAFDVKAEIEREGGDYEDWLGYRADWEGGKHPHIFECRRYAPRPLKRFVGHRVTSRSWSFVSGDDWCGEHHSDIMDEPQEGST